MNDSSDSRTAGLVAPFWRQHLCVSVTHHDGLRLRRGGYWRHFFGDNRCNRSCGRVYSLIEVASEAPGGVHPGTFECHSVTGAFRPFLHTDERSRT